MTDTNRPNPLADALGKVGPLVATLVAVVTGLGGAGVFSAAQVDAVTAYGDTISSAAAPSGPLAIAVGAVMGLVSGGAVLLGVLRAGRGATNATTPLIAPQDQDGMRLVREDGRALIGSSQGFVS